MRFLAAGLALTAALSAPARASENTLFVSHGLLRYYDATNAVLASQLFGVPMPLVKAKEGDWGLSLSPAYNRVEAAPLAFNGGSLNLGYNRRLGGGFGVYGLLLTNYVRSESTTDSGFEPNDRLLVADFFNGINGTPTFAGAYDSGGSITTFIESVGLTYTMRRDRRTPVTLFGGPVITQSYARDIAYSYAFRGSDAAGTFALDGQATQDLDAYFWGATVGGVTQFEVGRFVFKPHLYLVALLGNRETGSLSFSRVERENGAVIATRTGTSSFDDSIENFVFPIPGLEIFYRDWALGISVLETFGGPFARSFGSDFLHGAYPVTVRLTKLFGPAARAQSGE